MSNIKTVNKGTWKKDLRLYVHVPFCVKKCGYCDFISAPSNEKEINSYFDALYKEIQSYKNRTNNYLVSSLFIGGGTPSCVESKYIVDLIRELKDVFEFDKKVEPEITIEVNPGTNESIPYENVIYKKLMDYKEAGINRISFGLQSAHDHELKMLGRIHNYLEFEENYYLARELGFKNINIDLMSALPGQSLQTWEETVQKVISLQAEHISAYSLIIEEETPFYALYGPDGSDRDKLPSEEIDRMIYYRTKEMLTSYGYERYEISNYAKKGYECKHNLAYWEGTSYLGLGLGSASLIGNRRFTNINFLQGYINNINGINNTIMSTKAWDKGNYGLLLDAFDIRRDLIDLNINQEIEEFMFLGLRKIEGVSKQLFMKRFKISMEEIYGQILERLNKDGLILIDDDLVRLTELGIDISNRVLAEFLI